MADLRDEPAAEGPEADEETSAPRDELEEQRRLAETYLDLARRTQADFLNFKRRAESEQVARADAARAEVIMALLPTLDEFELAVTHVPREAASESWVQGIALIGRKLAAALERLGVQRVGAEGEPFNPQVHEAVLHDASGAYPEGHVARILRPGYLLGDRVIRPAQVAVAQGGPLGENGRGTDTESKTSDSRRRARE